MKHYILPHTEVQIISMGQLICGSGETTIKNGGSVGGSSSEPIIIG